jgi:predicted nucleic acid-binding Zn ribbon protein
MARGPKLIGGILSELMARRGYARVQSARAYEMAWREAAGELAARYTRVGSLRRGTLEVIALNSTLVQEMTFQKPSLLRILNELLPDEGIDDLRFRVGEVC